MRDLRRARSDLPRFGDGARNGASVSARISSAGVTAAASRSARRVPERHRPGEAQHVTGLGAALGHLRVAGEAVEDHLLRRAVSGQDRQHVLVRVPVVDHQRLACLLGDLDVRPEPVSLHLRRGVVPVVVQPGLTDRPDLRQRGQPRRSRPAPRRDRPAESAAPPSRSGGWPPPRTRRGTRPRSLPPTVTTARRSRL